MISRVTYHLPKFSVGKIQCNTLLHFLQVFYRRDYTGSATDGIGELGRSGVKGGKNRKTEGVLGVRSDVKEEEYFHNMQQQQIEDLKKKLEEENIEYQRRIEELKKNVNKIEAPRHLNSTCNKHKK